MTGIVKQTAKKFVDPNADFIGLFNNGVLVANGELKKIRNNSHYFSLPHVRGECINSFSCISLMFFSLVDTSYASHVPVAMHIDFWHKVVTFLINREKVGKFLHKNTIATI